MTTTLVISDNHGDRAILERIVAKWADHVDVMIHCGDSEIPATDPLMKNFLRVAGNNDWHLGYVADQEVVVNGCHFLVTHGHHDRVNFTLTPLMLKGAAAGADVVCFGFASVWGDEAVMKVVGGEETLFDGNDRAFTALFDKRFKYFCWDKLYRRALYDGLRYPVGRIYEDAYLLPAVISRAQKLLMLPDVLYYYRMRPMSITHTRDGRLNQWLEATSPLVELAKEKYPQYLDLAWGRYNIIQLRSLDAIFECDRFRKHPCWKFQYRLLRKRLGALLFQRCPQVRPMRRAYALAALLCPDLVAAYVRRRCRRDRGILTYEH